MPCLLYAHTARHGRVGSLNAASGCPAQKCEEMVSVVVRRNSKIIGFGVMLTGLALLGGCSSETGRVPFVDTDVSCLRKQMKGPMFLSFPLAANTCQRMSNHNFILNEKNAHPLPLNLKDAPDLQKQADEYGYSYTK